MYLNGFFNHFATSVPLLLLLILEHHFPKLYFSPFLIAEINSQIRRKILLKKSVYKFKYSAIQITRMFCLSDLLLSILVVYYFYFPFKHALLFKKCYLCQNSKNINSEKGLVSRKIIQLLHSSGEAYVKISKRYNTAFLYIYIRCNRPLEIRLMFCRMKLAIVLMLSKLIYFLTIPGYLRF